MICKKCGHRWRLHSGGMGYSDPPGRFFWVAIGALIVAALGGWLLRIGYDFGLILIALGGITAFYATGGVMTGIWAQRTYDGPNCPECDHRVARIWPWSL